MLTLIIVSCEDVVLVDTDAKNLNLITVEAYINTSQTNNVLVKLEKSLPIDQVKKNPPINDAVVEISDDQAPPETVRLEESGKSGIYLVPESKNYTTEPGRTYRLTITTPDGTIITGEEYLRKVEKLDTVKVNLSPRGDYEFLAIFISTQETPGPGDYYKWDIFINNYLLYGGDALAFASDELVDGNYVYDLEIFTDWYDEDDGDEDRILFEGDTIKVLQSSISRDAYDFYLGMQNQAFSGSPFSVPPANLPGNLSSNNGRKILGLFSARDISVGNSVVIDSSNFTPLVASAGS